MTTQIAARCPRCGSKHIVIGCYDECIDANTVVYYAECDCGAANLTIRDGKVTGIAYRDPDEFDYCLCVSAFTTEGVEYAAL